MDEEKFSLESVRERAEDICSRLGLEIKFFDYLLSEPKVFKSDYEECFKREDVTTLRDEPEKKRNFLTQFFGRKQDEQEDYFQNGTEFGKFIYQLIFDVPWFRPEREYSSSELEQEVRNVLEAFKFTDFTEKPIVEIYKEDLNGIDGLRSRNFSRVQVVNTYVKDGDKYKNVATDRTETPLDVMEIGSLRKSLAQEFHEAQIAPLSIDNVCSGHVENVAIHYTRDVAQNIALRSIFYCLNLQGSKFPKNKVISSTIDLAGCSSFHIVANSDIVRKEYPTDPFRNVINRIYSKGLYPICFGEKFYIWHPPVVGKVA